MRRRTTRKSGNQKRPKTKLGLPDLDHSKSAVLNSLRSPESKRGYRQDTGMRLPSSSFTICLPASRRRPPRCCRFSCWLSYRYRAFLPKL
jgi:hypothetical protein